MSEGTAKQNAENQVNTRGSGDKVDEYGFRQEGIQEQGYYYNGEYSDFVMMRVLREEW